MPSQAPFSGKGFRRILSQAVSCVTGTVKIITNAIQNQFHVAAIIHGSHPVPQAVKFKNKRAHTAFRRKHKAFYC